MTTTRRRAAPIDLPAAHSPLDVATLPACLRQVDAGTKRAPHCGAAW